MKYAVNFVDEGVTLSVAEGETLLEARIDAGLPADAPCGGRGTCGKCRAEVRAPGETEWQPALLCQTRVFEALEVRLTQSEASLRVLTDAAEETRDSSRVPLVRAVRLSVPPCPRGESSSDWSRLAGALERAGIRVNGPNPRLCRGLSALLTRSGGDIWVTAGAGRALELSADRPEVYLAAFDLGTTSIAGYLISADGCAVAAEGAPNPQARFGGDVISRADYALSHGVDALSGCAREAVDALLGRMCAAANVPRERVMAVSLAGNTAMHHLFLGISPDALVKAPYNPTVSAPLVLRASEYGLNAHPEALLCALPVIGGFVGADTVACLLSGDWTRREKLTLMIDIGTNGELVLGDRRRRVACSTAAGPAFEGAKIACGMRGADGAVDHAWLEGGALRWHVIGEGPARGICGSGLVDLAAALLASGELDDTGRLASGDRYDLGDTGVYLTQRDIREIQLAKAAMAAGLRLMAAKLGVGLEDIREVDVAGAFGSTIDPDSACAIGLIPPELRDRITAVGNAAGAGARLALMDERAWDEAEALARGTEFLELATLPEFQDEFVEQLSF